MLLMYFCDDNDADDAYDNDNVFVVVVFCCICC